jgi:hypothetical protein
VPSSYAGVRAAQLNRYALRSLVVSLCVCGLVGCTTGETRKAVAELPEAFQHCSPKQTDGWRLSAPPSELSAILSIQAERGTIDSELDHRGSTEAVHEHWFVKDESHFAACRHLDGPDACHSDATVAHVKLVEGRWIADGPVLETVCILDERIR